MSDRVASLLALLASLTIGFVLGVVLCTRRGAEPETIVVERVDTLVRVDTLLKPYPVPVEVRTTDTLKVPVPVPVEGPRDTVWAELPIEEKVYGDSTYRAVVSGYMPSLDSIEIYRRETIIDHERTVYVQPSPWSLSLQGGVGASKDGLSPYIGVGVSYRLWSPKPKLKGR